jgi:Beta propeller domain
MSTLDVEKGQPEPEQAVISDEMKRRRRFRIGMAVGSLIAIALIVGLSVGLTRPSNGSSSASTLQNQSNGSSTDNSSNPANPSPPTLQFKSTGRAFDVTMNLLSPAVLEGYDSEDALKADLDQAVRFYINTFIEDQILYGRMPIVDGPQYDMAASDDSMPTEGNAASGAAGTGGASAKGKTDYNTNNQNEGVDEADFIKSDGTHVFAAYGDVVVVWEAATGEFVTNYTLPPIEPSSQDVGVFTGGDVAMKISGNESMYVPWLQKAWISGMLLESGKLILFVSGYGPEVVKKKNITSSCYDAFATRIIVLDASKPLVLITQEDVQGTFQDARAIGNNIHVVSNCGFNFWTLTESVALWNDEFINMTDSEYRTAVAAKVEPLIEPFVDLMVADINAHGTAKIPKISLWGSRFGNNTAVVERANSGGAIQAFTSLISFSVANLNGDLKLSSAGACTPSSWGYTYSIDGWIVIATQGWEWNEELGGTGQTTHLLGFSLDGINASPALLGSFPGYITSQYSLSIYEGHLRVATTIETWFSDTPIVFEPANSTNATSAGNATSGTAMNATATNSTSDVGIIFPTNVSWPEPLSIVKNQVIILKIPTADGDVFEEVSRIADLGEDGERITAINYFGPIAYAGKLSRTARSVGSYVLHS